MEHIVESELIRRAENLVAELKIIDVFDQEYWKQLLPQSAVEKSALVNRSKRRVEILSELKWIIEKIEHYHRQVDPVWINEAFSKERFHQAQKMNVVGHLTASLAHDFNNMLGVIIGRCDLAMEQLQVNHPARKSIDQIKESALRASNLIRQLSPSAKLIRSGA